MMVDSPPRPQWRGKSVSDLSDQELNDAMAFAEQANRDMRPAPTAVWSYISSLLSDVTIEKAKRLTKLGGVGL